MKRHLKQRLGPCPLELQKADMAKKLGELGPTCPLRAKSGHLRRSKRYCYSITSSARAIIVPGMVMPSSFAVARLMTSSNFVGCSIGNSPGFAPRRILSVYSAARRGFGHFNQGLSL
jgi:hypothetical protein